MCSPSADGDGKSKNLNIRKGRSCEYSLERPLTTSPPPRSGYVATTFHMWNKPGSTGYSFSTRNQYLHHTKEHFHRSSSNTSVKVGGQNYYLNRNCILVFNEHFINQAILFGFFWGHIIVPVRILLDFAH